MKSSRKDTLALDLGNFADHLTRVSELIDEGSFGAASDLAKKMNAFAPSRPGPVLLLARIAQLRDGPARKVELLSNFFEQGLDNSMVKRELCRALIATGDFSRARALAEQTIAAGIANFSDYMIIARSYFFEENVAKAAEYAEVARHLAPSRPGPVLLLARIAQLRDGPARKAELLSDFLDQGLDDLTVKYELSHVLSNLGKIEEALKVAKSIDLEKCSGKQLFQLLEFFEMCGCKKEAESCLRRIAPTERMGNAALLYDYLEGKLDAETVLRLQCVRGIREDGFAPAIEGLCGAINVDGSVVDYTALGERLRALVCDCKGAESYFTNIRTAATNQSQLVSIVAPIHRADDQDNLLHQLARQDYPNLEVVIVINGPGIGETEFRDRLSECENYKRVQIVVLPPKTPLPKVLNTGLSATKGEYVARFDADDIYLDKYITRTINFMLSMSADICGKQQFFVHLDALDCVCLHGSDYELNAHINKMAGSGSTLVTSRKVIENIQFDENLSGGEDQDFYMRSWYHGFRTVFAPPFDHLVIRKTNKLAHTWKLGDLRFLMDSGSGGFLSLCSKSDFEKLLNRSASAAM